MKEKIKLLAKLLSEQKIDLETFNQLLDVELQEENILDRMVKEFNKLKQKPVPFQEIRNPYINPKRNWWEIEVWYR